MRIMKGEEDPEMAIGSIIFVISVAFLVFIVLGRYTDFSAVITTSNDEISSMAMAHTIAACLEGKIDASFGSSTEKAISECGRGLDMCVFDLDNGEKSGSCEGKKQWKQTVYFNIPSAGGLDMGGLNVNV